MDALAFVEKWRKSTRGERSAAHEHFFDLCELVQHPKPGELDPTGQTFTAERKVKKFGGKEGFADFSKQGFFAWEYKGKGADLELAFNQLLQYSGDLGNPPLLIVSDMDRIEIRTRFTGFPTKIYRIALDNLTWPANLERLRWVFHDPERFRPEKTIERITEEAALKLAVLAPSVRGRHEDSTKVAHFLDRLIFCMFAEDARLLPNGVFTQVFKNPNRDPRYINRDLSRLFEAMAAGGDLFGETIPYFNGNLFDETAPLELLATEFPLLIEANTFDWSEMDPSIFGTLFERVMDPAQRSRLGAHYTSYRDIATLVDPIVMAPLRREWAHVRDQLALLVIVDSESPKEGVQPPAPSEARIKEAQELVDAFLARLRCVRVLDPACGSGNFLYVAMRMLKDLEKDVLVGSRRCGLKDFELEAGPHQFFGIEKNPYAHDLARMTVWIGFLQWQRENGFPVQETPILRSLDNFELKDAILDESDPDHPSEPSWPKADFIVGNPPFLGGKRMRSELGDEYVQRLFRVWGERVRPEADLCCYWFERARRQVEIGACGRVGLLATQGIRGGANRETLSRIKESGDVFFAESDRPWILDGASVHVSMVGFDDGSEKVRILDGRPALSINANLTADADVTLSRRLAANLDTAFMGDTKGGSFEIPEQLAFELLLAPNPTGRPNSDVVTPWLNGLDVTRRGRNMWIVDFGVARSLVDAASYEAPFEYVKKHVKPARSKNKREAYRKRWWIHVEARPTMRAKLSPLRRFIVTATVSKHRLFVWIKEPILPDHQLIAFARSDDGYFGLLHSRVHEVWSRAQGTQVRERESGFRYTPTSCFETFPLPTPTPSQTAAIAAAAQRLDELRSNWLNPREWLHQEFLEFPAAVDGPWGNSVKKPNQRGIGTVRYPRLVPRDSHVYDMGKRTLTNLYNERPTWLDLAHKTLDEAVFDAYGWDPGTTDEALLELLLALNLERAVEQGPINPPPNDEIDDESSEAF